MEELGFVGLVGNYDLAIVDYDLGGMTGIEIGEYLAAFFDKLPMLLISGTVRHPSTEAIKHGISPAFLHKTSGPELILSTALDLN